MKKANRRILTALYFAFLSDLVLFGGLSNLSLMCNFIALIFFLFFVMESVLGIERIWIPIMDTYSTKDKKHVEKAKRRKK